MDFLFPMAIYGAVTGTRSTLINARQRGEIKRLEEILTLHLQQQGEQIERLEARLKAIEGPSNDNTSPPRDAEPSQTIEKPPPTLESYVERVYDVIRRAIKDLPRKENPVGQGAEAPQVTEKPPPIPDQPAAQAEPGQSTSQAHVEKFFAAVLEKNRRQAAGQRQDPQVDRAVRMVMEALDEHASDSELSRYIDVALDAMQHHAASWANYRKK